MSRQAASQDQADAFVAKLHDFMNTLDEPEQCWLAALLTRPSAEEDVQGYLLPPGQLDGWTAGTAARCAGRSRC